MLFTHILTVNVYVMYSNKHVVNKLKLRLKYALGLVKVYLLIYNSGQILFDLVQS